MEGDVATSFNVTDINLINVWLDLGDNQGDDDHRNWEDTSSHSSLQS